MNFSIELISAVLSGAVASGIIITLGFLLFGKSIKKSKQSNLAKELKNNKELEFIKANIKQLNSHLQLDSTQTAKLLDSFNVEQEQIDNFVIAQKSKKKELSEKDKKKATKFKIV
ncbi:hypothetical protein [Spiroplasma endosymbiont of Polydrusus pterygomalis]|uniref:hypothetical protein n=1 Tax=Spiroplasma endosymbiont of Polydrusus pterygomalis TaxID=3139327 RepID=UPI003CCA9512